jgi:hypothetical protein
MTFTKLTVHIMPRHHTASSWIASHVANDENCRRHSGYYGYCLSPLSYHAFNFIVTFALQVKCRIM